MTIEILYFDGCPNHAPTEELVRDVIGALSVDAEIRLERVETPEAAEKARFIGSPTVRIDGVDIDPVARDASRFGLTCRRYGTVGVPPRELIEAAIHNASGAAQ